MTVSMLSVARRGAAVLGLVAAAACGGSDPVAPTPLTVADVVGTYALASINGQHLPAPYGQGTAIVYDTLALARDSTWLSRQGGGALGSSVAADTGTYTPGPTPAVGRSMRRAGASW